MLFVLFTNTHIHINKLSIVYAQIPISQMGLKYYNVPECGTLLSLQYCKLYFATNLR